MTSHWSNMSWRTIFPSAIPVSNPPGAPVNVSTCKTGSTSINLLFCDGLPSSSILEIVGESGAGKTQLCISSAVASASMGRRVLYIDSCNGIAGTRLEELVAARYATLMPIQRVHRFSSDRILLTFSFYRKNSTTVGGTTALSRKSTMSGILRDSYCSDVLSRIRIQRARDPWTLLDILTAAAESHVNARAHRSVGSNKRVRRSSSSASSSSSSSVINSVVAASPHTSYDLIVIDCLHTLIAPYAGLGGVLSIGGSSSGGGGKVMYPINRT